jgi:hypothetical protein
MRSFWFWYWVYPYCRQSSGPDSIKPSDQGGDDERADERVAGERVAAYGDAQAYEPREHPSIKSR